MMDAEQVLRANGWFPGRRVDASTGERALVAAGYSTWPELTALLLEFSGISIPFKRHGRNDTVWFDAERAVSWADPASVHDAPKNTPLRRLDEVAAARSPKLKWQRPT